VRKTIPVRLAAAPSSEPQEVSSNDDGGTSRESAPMDNTLGISVEPLSQENVRDSDLRQVMRSGGGLIVSQVSPEGPAYQHLQDASQGNPDIILKVNGTQTGSRAELRQALAGVKRGDIVTLTVLSGTQDGWQQRVVRLRAN
jgi:S1-C subfamily serine protease